MFLDNLVLQVKWATNHLEQKPFLPSVKRVGAQDGGVTAAVLDRRRRPIAPALVRVDALWRRRWAVHRGGNLVDWSVRSSADRQPGG